MYPIKSEICQSVIKEIHRGRWTGITPECVLHADWGRPHLLHPCGTWTLDAAWMANSLLKGQRLPNVSRHITRPNTASINKSLTHKQEATRTSNRLGNKVKPKTVSLNFQDVRTWMYSWSLTTCSTQTPLKVAHAKSIEHLWHVNTLQIHKAVDLWT